MGFFSEFNKWKSRFNNVRQYKNKIDKATDAESEKESKRSATSGVKKILSSSGSSSLGVFDLFISLLGLASSASRKVKHRRAGLAEIDEMSGQQFEEFVRDHLQNRGADARKTSHSNDYGIDVIAEIEGQKVAVQCKRYKSKVSQPAVREAVAGKDHFNCNASMVVTNNYFTSSARELAESTDCYLINRDDLTEWIKQN